MTSINLTASASRFSYYIQDATGGIYITKGGEPFGGPVYNIGDRLLATGVIGQSSGLTQLELLAPLADNVSLLGSGFTVAPTEVTIGDYLADPERFEALYIRLMGVTRDVTSPAWPGPSASANMILTDGFQQLVLRIDSDTDIPGQSRAHLSGKHTRRGNAVRFRRVGEQRVPDNAFVLCRLRTGRERSP